MGEGEEKRKDMEKEIENEEGNDIDSQETVEDEENNMVKEREENTKEIEKGKDKENDEREDIVNNEQNNVIKCPVCPNAIFSDPNALQEHIDRSRNDHKLVCRKCFYRAKNNFGVNYHNDKNAV